MTITTETARLAFAGDGSDNSPYAISFPLRDDDSVEVIYVTDSTGAEVAKVKTTDYTIAIAADFGSATLTLVTTAPATGETMVIRRSEPATRLSDYSNFDGQPSATTNADYDKGTMAVQTLQEQLDRAVLVAKGHPDADLPLTPLNLIGNAGKRIVVNAGETDWELAVGSALSGSGTLNTIPLWTPDGNTLGDSVMTQSGTVISVAGSLSATATITATGIITGATGSVFGNVTIADGSITDSSGAISFGNENLSTTGTFASSKLTDNGTSFIYLGDDALFGGSVQDGTMGLIVFNQDDLGTTSDALITVETDPDGGGDPYFRWLILSIQGYVMGIDNSDSDKLVLSVGNVLGTANVLEITTAGNATFKGTLTVDGVSTLTGDVTVTGLLTVNSDADGLTVLGRTKIGSGGGDEMVISHFDRTAEPAIMQDQPGTTTLDCPAGQKLIGNVAGAQVWFTDAAHFTLEKAVVGLDLAIVCKNTDNTNAASHSVVSIATGGDSAGDPSVRFNVTGTTSFAIGLDNTDSDKFVFSRDGVIGTNNAFEMSTVTGNATFKNTLTVDGVTTLTGDVTMTGDLAVNGGDITSTSGAISFGNEALSTTGGVTAGQLVVTAAVAPQLLLNNTDISIVDTQVIGELVWRSADGAGDPPAGDIVTRIEAIAEGDITSGGNWNIGLGFKTTSGAGVHTEKMRINARGVIVVGATSAQANAAAGDLQLEGGSLILKEITTPTADTGYGKAYFKADNKFYVQDGAGAEHEVAFV